MYPVDWRVRKKGGVGSDSHIRCTVAGQLQIGLEAEKDDVKIYAF